MGDSHFSRDRISGGARRRALRIGVPLTTLAVVAAGLTQAASASSTPAVSHAPAAVGGYLAAPAGARPAAAPSDSTKVDVDVLLKMRNASAMQAYAQAVSNPKSAYYKQYLTPAQITADFAPTQAAVDAVDAALRAAGLTPGTASADGVDIPVQATLGQLKHAFGVNVAGYTLADGRAAYGATSAPMLDGSVSPYVEGVLGLQNFNAVHTNTKAHGKLVAGNFATPAAAAAANAKPAASAPPMCSSLSKMVANYLQTQENGVPDVDGQSFYSPTAMASAYGTASQLAQGDTGKGVTVAVLEWEAVSAQALTDYKSCYGLSNPISYVSLDGGPKTQPTAANGVGGEASLDIEDIASMAPGASIIDYQGSDATDSNGNSASDALWLDPITKAVTDDRAQVISLSWGECEAQTDTTMRAGEQTDFELAALQGQSVFVAAGDDGSTDCVDTNNNPINQIAVDDPQNDPWVTAMGGTYMQGLTKPSVNVWNDSTYVLNGQAGTAGGAGGGGVDTDFQLTGAGDFQAGFTGPGYTNACNAPTGSYCRQTPDLSTLADWRSGFPQIAYADKSSTVVYTDGGTSWAAPTMAAITALADGSRSCQATGPVGFEDPALYQLASDPDAYAADFSDISTGNNDYSTSGYTGGLYAAAPGYDLASGLGSPKASTLIPALCTKVNRVQGPDVVQTAISVSQTAYRDNGVATPGLAQAHAVVLGSQTSYTDDLTAASLAAAKGGPLLLSQSASLNPATRNEIQRVLPSGATVYLVGGTTDLSNEVVAQLAKIDYKVVRITGADAYATADAVAQSVAAAPTNVLVADGKDYQASLSADSAAGHAPGTVVVLSDGGVLTPTAVAYLNSIKGSVRSAEGAGAAGYHALAAALASGAVKWHGVQPRNLTGLSAAGTSVFLGGTFYSLPASAYVTSTSQWPGAMAAAAVAGPRNSPLLWTEPTTLDANVAAFLTLEHTHGRLTQVDIVGGTDIVPANVEGQLRTALS